MESKQSTNSSGRPLEIALIGLTNLERLGIRELASGCPDAVCRDYRSLDQLNSLSEASAFVVDSETFMLNPSYFLPRRSQTVVVCRYSRRAATMLETEQSLLSAPMIFFDSSNMELAEAVAQAVSSARRVMANNNVELSVREKDVLREVASGLTNKEIADKLCISINTVITHRKNITSKLGIRSVSGLSLYAVMNALA